jgi:hypothetical protein
MKPALLFGLLNAVISIVFTVILYLIGVDAALSPVAYCSILIPLVCCVVGGLQQRKLNGGYLEFRDALKVTFQILVIGSLLSVIFNYIYLNYIDTPFRDALAQASGEKLGKFLEKLDMPEDKLDEAIEKASDVKNYGLGKMMLGFVSGCIPSFIIALIVSAIIKRKKHPFENSFKQ